jgi:thymidylate synthase (FAD)
MKVELKTEYSTLDTDSVPIMAARGDYMTDSLVGVGPEDAMTGTDKTAEELIADLIRKGHFGPFEHIQAFFAVEGISRPCMAQITRHRHMSFDVQSMRYVDFSEAEPVIPPAAKETYMGGVRADAVLRHALEKQMDFYRIAVDAGMKKEDARFFLPLSTPVNLTFSANARTLMHMIDLRLNGKAQWEIRELAEKVLTAAYEWAPLTFEAYENHTRNNSLLSP